MQGALGGDIMAAALRGWRFDPLRKTLVLCPRMGFRAHFEGSIPQVQLTVNFAVRARFQVRPGRERSGAPR